MTRCPTFGVIDGHSVPSLSCRNNSKIKYVIKFVIRFNSILSIFQIECLRGLGFSWTHIAKLFNISRQTLWRRAREWGMDTNTYSDISDEELETVIKEISQSHPFSGVRMTLGHLRI